MVKPPSISLLLQFKLKINQLDLCKKNKHCQRCVKNEKNMNAEVLLTLFFIWGK